LPSQVTVKNALFDGGQNVIDQVDEKGVSSNCLFMGQPPVWVLVEMINRLNAKKAASITMTETALSVRRVLFGCGGGAGWDGGCSLATRAVRARLSGVLAR
jgi:hypothetical protein